MLGAIYTKNESNDLQWPLVVATFAVFSPDLILSLRRRLIIYFDFILHIIAF
jgi:hypothetical protein